MHNKRIAKKVNNRTLPHYAQYDDTPHARGFVTSSYVKGLRPAEFFFLTMSGRDGLIDTAIKTADTGYIQRKFIKGMEDVMIYYDGLVRSANNQIIQYFYGGSNCSGTLRYTLHPINKFFRVCYLIFFYSTNYF